MGWFKRKQRRNTIVTSLIGENSRVESDCLRFEEGIHVDGFVGVDIAGAGAKVCTASVSEDGEVDGSIRANNVVIAGVVRGDIIASGYVHLLQTARIGGRIECGLLEKDDGAIVQGSIRKIS